jgi:hypothetical protein
MERIKIVGDYFAFWCLACSTPHRVEVRHQFDHNFTCPSFNREIRLNVGPFPASHPLAGQTVACHSRIKRGRITYLAESTHACKGMTIPLPTWKEITDLHKQAKALQDAQAAKAE